MSIATITGRTRRTRARAGRGFRARFLTLESSTKVKKVDVIAFARELATLLDSGIPAVKALTLIGEQRRGTLLEPVARRLVRDLNAGITLADAMSAHPAIFSNVFVRTVAASDRGAPVSGVLRQAADFLDTADSALSQAKKALIYPGLVLTVGLGVVVLLLTVVLPNMTLLLTNLNQGLPLPTRILMWLSDFLLAYKLYLAAGLLVLVIGGTKYLKSPAGRLRLHMTMLRLPVVSTLVIYNDVARAASTMSALTQAGLQLPEAVEVATETVSNQVIKAALNRGKRGLLAGEGLAKPLAATGILPSTFLQTLRVAEDTGTLDANLKRMAEYYQREAEGTVKTLVGLVEPISTVVIALIVGFIAMAVVMPMYSALGSLGQ